MKHKIKFGAMILALVAFCGLQTADAEQPKTSNVVVTNTAANPVPVSVQNPVSVTGSVTVANPTTAVTIQNTPSVKSADNPAFQPYLNGNSKTTGLPSDQIRFDVPAGKRLVIEYVSARARVPNGQNVIISVDVFSSDGTAFGFDLPRAAEGTDESGEAIFTAGQSLRLYSSAKTGGVGVEVDFERSNAAGQMLLEASVSGYLVDLP